MIKLSDGSFYFGEINESIVPNGFGIRMSSDLNVITMSYFEDNEEQGSAIKIGINKSDMLYTSTGKMEDGQWNGYVKT